MPHVIGGTSPCDTRIRTPSDSGQSALAAGTDCPASRRIARPANINRTSPNAAPVSQTANATVVAFTCAAENAAGGTSDTPVVTIVTDVGATAEAAGKTGNSIR